MQVTETNTDGLKREFRILIPAGELEEKVTNRLGEIGRTITLPGFRPGKVPMQILRSRFGKSVLGEVLESTVQESSAEAIRDHNLRPALPPKVENLSFSEGTDLEYNMSLEVLPEIPDPNFADLDIERLVVEVPEADVERALERIAEQQRKSETVGRPAASGDIVVVDIEGRSGDREIPGASGKDRQIALGSGAFIPGFEDQLIGASAGEHRTLRLTFPEDYGVTDFAGKEAVFEVDVKDVRQLLPAVIDDELGKAVGLESLAELREEVQQQMQRDYSVASRLRLKRNLLDRLAERYDFPVPPGMLDVEFENIWRQYQAEKESEAEEQSGPAASPSSAPTDVTESAGEIGAPTLPNEAIEASIPMASIDTPETAKTESAGESAEEATHASAPPAEVSSDDETAREEYRRIAERRVRLGLLLAEVGRSNNITVTQDEMNQAITREARRHPGYERQVLDFYRQHPEAAANLRAPIFEDKVIDFIVELASVQERKVTPQELLSMPDPEAPAPQPSPASGGAEGEGGAPSG
jgi:trigger factor